MKIIPLALTTVLALQGCATHINGDLATEHLSSTPLPIQIVNLVEKNVGTGSVYFHKSGYEDLLSSLKSADGKIIPAEEYTLVVDYNVSSLSDGLMPWVTMLTLGIIPLYSSSNADAYIQIFRGNSVVYETKIDSRTHTVYGWWLVSRAEKERSPDMINWHEGAGIDYFKYEAIRNRIEGRLSKLMENESVYNQIMK